MLYEELKSNRVYIPEGVKKIYESVIKEGRSLVINSPDLNSDDVPNGTLFIDEATSKMQIKKHGRLQSIQESDVFDPESLTGLIMQKNSIDANRLRERTITNIRIQQETITGNEIQNHTIAGQKLLFDTIEQRHIMNNSIAESHIKNNAITSDKIQEMAIDANHIVDSAIRSRHMTNGTIESWHIVPDAIDSSKIQSKSIQAEHISDDNVLGVHISDNQINEAHLIDSCVSESKLVDESVTTAKLQTRAVTHSKIAEDAIASNNLCDRSVGFSKLDKDVEGYILNSLQVQSGTAALKTLNASENVSTKNIKATGEASVGTLDVSKNATVDGRLHVKGDVTTDGRLYRVAFNDIAEAYIPGEALVPGDVVSIADDGKVYKSMRDDQTVVGVYSDCFGDCFGASLEELESGKKIPVGLIGQVPVKIIGPIKIGQYIVAGDNGIAQPSDSQTCVRPIGKALKSSTCEDVHRVLCLIFPS